MEQALENIRKRVDAFGVGEPDIALSGNTIEVQIPGLSDGTVQQRPKICSVIADPTGATYGCASRREGRRRTGAPRVRGHVEGHQSLHLRGERPAPMLRHRSPPRMLRRRASRLRPRPRRPSASPTRRPPRPRPPSPTTSQGPGSTARRVLPDRHLQHRAQVLHRLRGRAGGVQVVDHEGRARRRGASARPARPRARRPPPRRPQRPPGTEPTATPSAAGNGPGATPSASPAGPTTTPAETAYALARHLGLRPRFRASYDHASRGADRARCDHRAARDDLQYCVVSSQERIWACFSTRTPPTERQRETGQESLIRLIGQTARLRSDPTSRSSRRPTRRIRRRTVTCPPPQSRTTKPARSTRERASGRLVSDDQNERRSTGSGRS